MVVTFQFRWSPAGTFIEVIEKATVIYTTAPRVLGEDAFNEAVGWCQTEAEVRKAQGQ